MPVTRRPGARWNFAGMGLLFFALSLLGRASAVTPGGPGLVRPAAGLALVWLLAQSGRGRAMTCVAAQALLSVAALTATGASSALTITTVVATSAQVVVAATLIRRWCPGILGTGGTTSVRTASTVGRGLVAVTVATLAGALIGGTGLAVEAGSFSAIDFASWWARNLTGVIVIGAVAHLAWEHLRGGRTLLAPHPRRLELLGLLVVSVAVYEVVFIGLSLPLAFLVIPLSVWAALRFPTMIAVVHTASFGSLAVALSLLGHGVFGAIADPQTEAIVVQAFLLTTMLTVLTIATGRDERAALTSELATSERASTERAELLDAMSEAVTDGLAVVAADGSILRMNTACEVVLAHTPAGSGAHATAYELRYPNGTRMPPSEYPFSRALREGTLAPHDVHLVLEDGGVRILSVSASDLTSDDITRALVVFRDVTRERLDRGELAAFAQTAAHDLRSPLTAVRGWLELAEMQLEDVQAMPAGTTVREDLDAVGRSLAHADRSSVTMTRMIDALLAQATAEGRELEAAAITMSGDGGLATEVADLLPGDVRVFVGDIPPVVGDVELIRQLLGNLLGNPVKYAEPDRTARVSVTGRRLGQRVIIEVTDNGVGIPPDQRTLVFDRFHRAHAGDARFSGTGLGLALCSTVVERHGGIIECVGTSEGVGSTFRFDLPAA